VGLQYYDLFALVYDFFTSPAHREHRVEAVRQLRAEPEQTILDAPCGTGGNFAFLEEHVGAAGRILGCDYSPGMLRKAGARVRKRGWNNVTLVEADARTLNAETFGIDEVDAAICMLGLTVVPDWEIVFERTYGLVKPGGRYVAMDLYLDGKPTSRFADWFFGIVASADSTRRFWEPLEKLAVDYDERDYPFFGGVARVVSATKPA
jgi:ubiquinone/menaquinone biosynthesis C-methylase UbiE